MGKSSITLKGTLDPQAFACILEDIARSIKTGTVCLRKGEEFLTLKPAGDMRFEIEASAKKGKQKLEFAVKWEEACETAPGEEITISDVEPEIPVEAGCEAASETDGEPLEGTLETAAPEEAATEGPAPDAPVDDAPEAGPEADKPKAKKGKKK